MPPRGRPTLVVLSLVASSSVASLSYSASSCDGAAACRSLVLSASCSFRRSSVLLAAYPDTKERKKENGQPKGGMGGRHAATPTQLTGILRRGVWCTSRRPPLGVRLFLSLFAVSLRFSLRSSCHLAVVPFSSCSPLSLLPLSRRSPLPRSATPPPPAGPLFSRRVLSPFGAAPPSSLHILAPRVYRALLAQAVSAWFDWILFFS